MRVFPAFAAFSLSLILVSSAAAAQDQAENCDRVLAYEDLVGSYTITLGNSILRGQGRTILMKTHDVVQGGLAAIGDSLVLTAPNSDVTFQFAGADEPDWAWDTDNDMAGLSSDDLGLTLGCDVSTLPRLNGTGTGRSAEGAPLDLTYRLVVPVEGTMFGQFQWAAQGMTMTRSVTFEAND